MRHVSLIALCSLLASPLPVWAEAKSSMTVAVSPASATAGSAGNTLSFSFTATERSDGQAVIVVPAPASGAPWSAPQTAVPSGAGFVTVQPTGCGSASLASITGNGPWSIAVDYKCSQKKSFVVTYRTTAATRAGVYEFTTTLKYGKNVLPVGVQPVVTVVPAAAATLDLTGLADAPAGTAQAAELAVFDAYGNPAAGYQGAVLFTSNDEQASLPALLAFSGAGPFLVQGVVLGTVGSRTVTVTDIANGALTDTQTTTVSPGPTSELRMHLAAQAIAFSVISFGNCGVTPYDAYGNITPAYTGTLFWSSSDAPAQLPVTAQWNPFALLGCVFHTAGDQTVTATDAANGLSVTGAIPVLGPVAHTDQVTVLNPIHPARITKPVFNTLANDSFGVLAVPTITSVSQATFTRDYVTRQLGIASKSPDGKRVILDLFPPEGSTAEAPGMELVRCPPTGDYDMCSIDVPIAMEYTATDGINTTTATVNLTLDGPMYIPFSVDLTLPATPPYSGSAGFVATDAPGFLIPISTPLTVNSITPNTIDPNLTTIVLSGQLCAAGTPGCTDVSRFQTTVTAAMPGDFVISSGQTVSFGQTASLILSSDPNAIEPSSIGIITPPTSTGFENLNAGAILNISDTQFFLGEQLLSKPPAATEFTVPTTVGMALRKAIATIEAAGFRAITCLNPAFLALVTGQDPAEGTKAAGSVVKIFYSGCSF